MHGERGAECPPNAGDWHPPKNNPYIDEPKLATHDRSVAGTGDFEAELVSGVAVNVEPLEAGSTERILGGVSKLEQLTGNESAVIDEDSEFISEVEDQLNKGGVTQEVINKLSLAFREFGVKNVWLAKGGTGINGEIKTPGFDTLQVGHHLEYNDTAILVIPEADGQKMKNLLAVRGMPNPDGTHEKFERTQFLEPAIDVEKEGFRVKFTDKNGEKRSILFLYGKVETQK